MNQLTKFLIDGILNEAESDVITALFAGGFKPPTKGHLEVVLKALRENPEIDQIYIVVGSGVRNGISQSQSIKIWEKYKKFIPKPTEIIESGSPIAWVKDYLKDHTEDKTYVLIGAREGDIEDEKDVEQRSNLFQKYGGEIKPIYTVGGISGTKAREAAKQSKEAFYQFLPDQLPTQDKEEIYNIILPTLNEVGEGTSKPYEWEKDFDEYVFTTDNNIGYIVSLSEMSEGDKMGIAVEFLAKTPEMDGYSSKIEVGKGELFRVMATIIDIIKSYLSKNPEIEFILYSPSKKTGEGDIGNQRDKLYKVFIQKQIPGIRIRDIGTSAVIAYLPKRDGLNLEINKPEDGNAAPYGSGYNKVDEKKDPKKGTGKKPKGSGRRLYTDEDPKDTVGIKFRTKEDIVDTLNKTSFKAKSHARQSQIINLIHQRVRAAYGKAKDPETKSRLKRGLDYIEKKKEASKEKTKRLRGITENVQNQDVKFKRPKLNYSYTSLQPYIDKETMEEHFDKHFKGYTDKLNAELDEKKIRIKAEDQIQAIQKILGKYPKNNTIKNNGGGFYNHVLYFENMTPDYKSPSSKFRKMLEENFNSFSEFKDKFKEAGLKQFGSGWVFLIKKDNKLVIESYANQDNPYLDKDFKGEILIAMDVWEHAYYLKHKSQRGKYISDFFRVIDYKVAEERLKEEEILGENIGFKTQKIYGGEPLPEIIKEDILDRTDLVLPRGKKIILQAEEENYNRGLIVELSEEGGYKMNYWYGNDIQIYPVEVEVDGESIKPDAIEVYMKFHPELKNENVAPNHDGKAAPFGSGYDKVKERKGFGGRSRYRAIEKRGDKYYFIQDNPFSPGIRQEFGPYKTKEAAKRKMGQFPPSQNYRDITESKTTHKIIAKGIVFSPKNITINVGDTVEWENKEGYHNVNGKTSHPRNKNNPESFGNKVGSGWTYKFTFTKPGLYKYHCDPHLSADMVGTIQVKENVKEGDTYEKMAAKGKKAGNLKQGTVKKRLGIPKDKKIPLSLINKEIARLKKMDKDPDKKGAQLGDKNQKYYKALQLAKTLKTTTNVSETGLEVAKKNMDDYKKSNRLNENASYSKDIDIKGKIMQLTQHMLDKGYNIEPLPTVEFVNGDSENAREFLGKTAYYNPETQTIVLYTEGRHPKDIVRSFAHEMIHHIQNLEGRLGNITTTNTQEDDYLNDIEAEANLKGTMTFRNWTDSLNETNKPYKHKHGFDDKLGKDPFGLNQFAREIAEEVISEGRYDTLANKLSSIAFEAFKDIHDRGDKEGSFKFRVDHPDDEHDIPSEEFYFDFEGVVEITDDEYNVDGGANAGFDTKGNEITPLLSVKFKIPQNPDWQEVSFNIKDVIRHELEHLTQDGDNEKPGKYIEDDQLIRDLIDAKLLPKSQYFKLEKEIDAMLQGLYFKAKKSKRPFKDVINNYLNIFLDQETITQEEKNDILKIWKSRAKSLSLPLFENKSISDLYTIYLDMDGVIADFDKRFMGLAGMGPREYESSFGREKFWDFIDNKIGVKFWTGIEWMPEGKKLYDFVKQFDHKLLSAPSRNDASKIGKRMWVKKNTPGTQLTLAAAVNKKNYADKSNILIDDRESNIQQWKDAGGIGILFKSTDQVIDELKKIMNL
jgi:Fe-Mn family superoxide dismutase